MKNTATITFHASHNYGSVLQAYALQNVIESFGFENEIINLRTARQVDLYTVLTKRRGIKYIFKNASHLLYYNKLKIRYARFEDFINNKLKLTAKTFTSIDDIKKANLKYDCFIAGSDQIWNPVPSDFDWSYYLPFVKEGKRIAYAPSFGQLASQGNSETVRQIEQYLKDFDFISVREKGAQKNVEKILGISPEIVLDPTLLLNVSSWDKLIKKEPVIKGDYIFLYTLFADKEIIKIAKNISVLLNMPIVTSNFSNQFDVFTPFKKVFDAGPEEFLSLVKNAKLVLSSSFHGTVFSIIFHTPFFAIRGNTDARISNLLLGTGLECRTIDINDFVQKSNEAFLIDFKIADKNIIDLKKKSKSFLENAINEE